MADEVVEQPEDSLFLKKILPNPEDVNENVVNKIAENINLENAQQQPLAPVEDIGDSLQEIHDVIALPCSGLTGLQLSVIFNVFNFFCFLFVLKMVKDRSISLYLADMRTYVLKISTTQLLTCSVASCLGYFVTNIVAVNEEVDRRFFTLYDMKLVIGLGSFISVNICIMRFMSYLIANSDFHATIMQGGSPPSASSAQDTKKGSKKKSKSDQKKKYSKYNDNSSVESEAKVDRPKTGPFKERKAESSVAAIQQFFMYGIIAICPIILLCLKIAPGFIVDRMEEIKICIPSEMIGISYKIVFLFILFTTFNVWIVFSEKFLSEETPHDPRQRKEPFGSILTKPFLMSTSAGTSFGWFILLAIMYFAYGYSAMQYVLMWQLYSCLDAGWMIILSLCIYTANRSFNYTGMKVVGIP